MQENKHTKREQKQKDEMKQKRSLFAIRRLTGRVKYLIPKRGRSIVMAPPQRRPNPLVQPAKPQPMKAYRRGREPSLRLSLVLGHLIWEEVVSQIPQFQAIQWLYNLQYHFE